MAQVHPSWYVPTDGDKSRFEGADGLPSLRLIPYRDSGGEEVLRLCEDATGLLVSPTDRRLPAVGVYVSQLRGEAYHQAGCRAGDFAPGAPVRLVREPDNPHDRYAVAVHDATGEHRAAYVNKQKARMLTKLLDAGEPLDAISIRGTAGGAPCGQVAIIAARPAVIDRLLSQRPDHLPVPAHLR
ncbi:MAG TPA: HIRAN domain-containing protein [Micromonospora sp.]|nr:HIRAN domain-containing protein [Micromonospora sp.]